MHWRPMPPSKPGSVATAQSWPTAPAADGRTQCDLHGVQYPARSLAAGWVRFASQAPARFAPELSQARQDRPFGRTSGPRRLSGLFLADGGGTLHHCVT